MRVSRRRTSSRVRLSCRSRLSSISRLFIKLSSFNLSAFKLSPFKSAPLHILSLSLFLGLTLPSSASHAETDQAKSLDELLLLIKSAKVSESKEHKQREFAFKQDRSQQAQLLRQAKWQKEEQELRSTELEKAYAQNELQLDVLREKMQERLGTLKELFGHINATTSDTVVQLDRSLVSVELPGRTKPLNELIAKMSSNSRLPSLEDIETLAYEISREIVEAGRISRFTAPVLRFDGSHGEQEVIRVGLFNLLSNGHYLSYNPNSGVLAELPNQPRHLSKGALALQTARDSSTPLAIDPTGPAGGNLLMALLDRPSLVEKWHQGGLVGYMITALGAVALSLALWRAFVLRNVYAQVNVKMKSFQLRNLQKDSLERQNQQLQKAQMKNIRLQELQEHDLQLQSMSHTANDPLSRVLAVADLYAGLDPESMELKLHEAILKERPAIETGLNLLKIISMIAPLMGLLGTVTGMIIVFQQITIFGAGDPKLMAGGISQALVTTVLGLLVAIPALLLHTWVNGYARRILHVLEEQSAGVVALKAEAKQLIAETPREN